MTQIERLQDEINDFSTIPISREKYIEIENIAIGSSALGDVISGIRRLYVRARI